MSRHLLPSYEPTDHEHVCCLDSLLFSSEDICLYLQYLFYVHSLLESSKTARCIAFGWSLKKYQVPIICLLISYDIVRAQCWGTGSHRATHCSQQNRDLLRQGLPHLIPWRCRAGWEGSWGHLPPQGIRHLPEDGDVPRLGQVVSLWVGVRIRPREGNWGQRQPQEGLCTEWNRGIRLWIHLLWVVDTGTILPGKSIRQYACSAK